MIHSFTSFIYQIPLTISPLNNLRVCIGSCSKYRLKCLCVFISYLPWIEFTSRTGNYLAGLYCYVCASWCSRLTRGEEESDAGHSGLDDWSALWRISDSDIDSSVDSMRKACAVGVQQEVRLHFKINIVLLRMKLLLIPHRGWCLGENCDYL